jgi:conjugal transfer pilus assembly protein TraD
MLVFIFLTLWKHWQILMEEKEYIENFKVNKPLVIKKEDIPVSDGIYLGEGFKWETRHAQYVYDKMKDDISKTIAQTRNSPDILGGVNFHAIAKKKEKADIFIPKVEFSGHCCIVATTRAGKTTLLRSIATQLIRAKEPIVIIDPKGEHFLLNTIYEETLKTYGSTEPFVFLSASFPLSTDTFNPFKTFVNVSDVGDRVASVLPQTGDSAPFVSFSFYMVDVITRCLVFLGEDINLRNLKKYSLSPGEWKNLAFKVFEKFFKENNLQLLKRPDRDEKKENKNQDDQEKQKGFTLDDYKYSYFCHKKEGIFSETIENLIAILEHPKEHLQKMTASLIPFFSLLSSDEKPLIFASEKPTFEWEKIQEKRVVYFFFSSLEAVKTVPLVLKLSLQSLISFVGRRQIRGEGGQAPIWLLIDEFGQVNYPEFADLLAQAGSSGLKVIMAVQSLSDLEKSSFGSEGGSNVAQRILDNTNIKIFLRNADSKTAEKLAENIGKVSIREVSRRARYKPEDLDFGYDMNYDVNIAYKDKYLLDPSWMQALPKGEAFVYTSGVVYKVKIPIFDLPETIFLTKEGNKTREHNYIEEERKWQNP